MKSLRVDLKAQRRINLARDRLLDMTAHQLANMTPERLQRSFGLLPSEAAQLLTAFAGARK